MGSLQNTAVTSTSGPEQLNVSKALLYCLWLGDGSDFNPATGNYRRVYEAVFQANTDNIYSMVDPQ